MDNTCVCCGTVIPEGRMVCPGCLHNNAFAYSNDIQHKKRKTVWNLIVDLDRKIRSWSIRMILKGEMKNV